MIDATLDRGLYGIVRGKNTLRVALVEVYDITRSRLETGKPKYSGLCRHGG